jgi:hypothetical protein
VRSVTAKLRNDIARRFRERPENALLILTKRDYEELEFVLLERVVSRSESRRAALKQAIRPIPLTVNRLNPNPIALRVLKRFTFTEEDAAYQWEKLRSAYMLAEWSEEYFNNRALFSDYYLKERLKDEKITPEWREDVRPIGREIFRHLSTARKNYSKQREDAIRKGLFEPVFKLLGFEVVEAEAEPRQPNTSQPVQADYLLYMSGDRGKPIAAALTYVWNRNLDDVDEGREPEVEQGGTPFEIPGAMVVSLLEKPDAPPWVIVTNGKLWRLYSATTSNKATNYYEVDLEEALAATEQGTALKYWWLMFRAPAFTGFLDKVLSESEKYAKELGERLKEDVFLKIFPQFAKGFIADMRGQGVKEADINLDGVFSGTMTFLYRMMFILYAESLELLPVTDERGYGEYSLYALKRDLARVGGENETDAPELLKKGYSAKSTAIYERLKTLFHVIDKGSENLNMPTYNGGLFSAENDAGRFLETYAIPDQFLMLGLDRLTRDEDDKTKKLVFIDFKSLGVRQLGSIYEGLLEFKLKIAAENLAVERDGKREVYVPLAKAKKGTRGAAPAVAVDKDQVYLENDKQERKATGSYYTPDYIVKYIVQHTVGPVLERKLKSCEDRLAKAQGEYRDYVKLVAARNTSFGKDESPRAFWDKPDMLQLVDDCLNLRVLDPAMGSGHFLVEAVDFISNKMIHFLNGWSENPVWAALDRIREDILADMLRQNVTIDNDKLTRVALIKRAVLKRCVYGVDLNHMAVELAKVSLWLDAFTLGAPLSFLDHHLKWGNSLIGARVKDVQTALEGQQTLFSQNKFAGVMLATDLMQKVSYLSDNTVAQVQASQDAYRSANDHLAPYKRVLDVYTSRWFGNTPGKAKRGGAIFDPTIEFLRREDTQDWLEDPRNPKNRLPADDYMKAGLVAKTSLTAAGEKRFFHWELEFPEIFFAPSRPGGQDVQLRENGGFDAVVGNPPYVRPHNLEEQPKRYYQAVYETFTHKSDLLVCFLEITKYILRKQGFTGMITSDTWLYLDSFQNLRNLLLTHMSITSLVPFEAKDIFEDAAVRPVVITYGYGGLDQNRILVKTVNQKFNFDTIAEIEHELFRKTYKNVFDLSLRGDIPRIKNKIAEIGISLGDIAQIDFGLKTGDDQKFIGFEKKSLIDKPLIRGDDTYRYFIDFKGEYVHYDPQAMRIHRDTARPGESERFEEPKILVKDTSSIGFNCTYDDQNYYAKDMLIVRKRKNAATPIELITICGILNSTMMKWYYETTFPTVHVQSQELSTLPIRRIDFTTPGDERERLTQEIVGVYNGGDSAGVLERAGAALDADKSDVVHDVLAGLAQAMIDLNKRKQAEVKRFLSRLESQLKIAPKKGEGGIDSLTGKTIIQGYLGDYQKGEAAVSWKDFYYRLHQNRNRFGVALSAVEAEIGREYEKSLSALLPVKEQLARTDALIDKIVYKLYGLTEAEIELIERPQFEQGLAEAKAQVVADKAITDDEIAVEKIAEAILPHAERFFDRVEAATGRERLDADLPGWEALPPEVPTFLLTAEYLLTMPLDYDFSPSIISYSKSVETTLHQRIFKPFRDTSGYTAADCHNDFLKRFFKGERELTLGSFPIILSSSKEPALRRFIESQVSNADTRFYGGGGVVGLLNDQAMVDIRNAAAHDERLGRDAAERMRAWALAILRGVISKAPSP